MTHKLLILSFLLLSAGTPTTEQVPDILNIDNKTYYLLDFPIDQLKLKDAESETEDIEINTACWRRYQATWNIRNDSLFLFKMTTCFSKEEINMQEYFDQRASGLLTTNGELFANWFSLELVNYEFGENYLWNIPWRKLKDEEIFISFENGILTKKPK